MLTGPIRIHIRNSISVLLQTWWCPPVDWRNACLQQPMFCSRDVSLVCKLNFLHTCCWSSTSQIICSEPNSSISGILNSAGPLPGTTKNLHGTTLFFNQTEEKPNFLCFNYCFFRITELFLLCLMILLLPFEINISIIWKTWDHQPWRQFYILLWSICSWFLISK